MFRNKYVVGIVPARGGSQRLPKKNMREINGRSLLSRTINAGQSSKLIDKLVVSTDNIEIEQEAINLDVDKVIRRPDKLATNDASMTSVVVDTLRSLCRSEEQYEYLVLLQPTSPLRTGSHIDKAFKLIQDKNGIGAISLSRTDHPVEWMGKISDDGLLDSFFYETKLEMQSQEFSPTYQINGAIYIVPTVRFLEEKTFFLSGGMVAYIMNRSDSIDIDDEYDLNLAECLILQQELKLS